MWHWGSQRGSRPGLCPRAAQTRWCGPQVHGLAMCPSAHGCHARCLSTVTLLQEGGGTPREAMCPVEVTEPGQGQQKCNRVRPLALSPHSDIAVTGTELPQALHRAVNVVESLGRQARGARAAACWPVCHAWPPLAWPPHQPGV